MSKEKIAGYYEDIDDYLDKRILIIDYINTVIENFYEEPILSESVAGRHLVMLINESCEIRAHRPITVIDLKPWIELK